MDQWKELLADVDDDYLIGISNKGILKRAYKDKEEIAAVINNMDEEASVKVGDETVSVRFPLGESKCTCPSRSICRHVVQAILVLKESCCKGDSAENAAAGSNASDTDSGAAAGNNGAENGVAQGAAAGNNGAENGTAQDAAAGNNGAENGTAQGAAAGNNGAENGTAAESTPEVKNSTAGGAAKAGQGAGAKVRREIEQFPLAQLKKVLGSRQLQILHNQYLSGVKPEIQYSSIVTVKLPEQGMVVKLLSPLEYSSCTCHKKEMCIHKASAILWCQLDRKSVV